MLVSHNWLQKYFDQTLPSPDKMADLFTFHIFEVEGVEKKMIGGKEDSIYDLKVLPDRAHYCLCHKGIAGEVAAMVGQLMKKSEIPLAPVSETRALTIEVTDWKACRRYIGRVIEGVKVEESPEWLRNALASIGQRSINSVVDSANYIMFNTGNPLHAFDADKVKGGIIVRYAKEGERIVTLDNKDVALNPEVLVIADSEGPLAIAGIKGGKRAEVDMNTTALILEAANFEPALIRRASQKLGIKTDASKRFENEISESIADQNMEDLTSLVWYNCGMTPKCGPKEDIYPAPRMPWNVSVSPEKISQLLGVSIPEEKIISIFESLQMKVEKAADKLVVTPPLERLDIAIPEDLVEEAGRLYGYDKIAGVPLPPTSFLPKQNGHFAATNILRSILVKRGFSEIYGYALTHQGDVELANPLASDKSHLRTDLSAGLFERLKSNFSHTLFDKDSVRLFEVGKSFPKEGERLSVAFGSIYKNKKLNKSKEDVAAVIADIEAAFGMKLPPSPITARKEDDTSAIVEISLGDRIRDMQNLPDADLSSALKADAKFKPFSAYPRIIRDVALFAKPGTDAEKVAAIIRSSMGELVAEGPFLFDRFEKKAADGSIEKISLAYRMVFQSSERTLSDAEVNPQMLAVIAALEKEGFEVRK